MTKKNLKKIHSSGFTLIELLVAISIFVITTGIVMSSQSKFDNSILLTNTVYDIAITLRQAQTYGVNVRGFNDKFDSAYGVYFDKASNPKKFAMFYDSTHSNGVFDGSCPGDDECVSSYKITRGHYIKSLCAGADAADCSDTSTLAISFKRPDTDAVIKKSASGLPLNYAKIVISSADGTATSSVVVTKTGQIYVEK